jgi:hypothetical protein
VSGASNKTPVFVRNEEPAAAPCPTGKLCVRRAYLARDVNAGVQRDLKEAADKQLPVRIRYFVLEGQH